MSKFTDFYTKMTTDDAVSTDVKKIMADNNVKEGTLFADLSDDVFNALIPVAKEARFDFTLEEIKAYFAKADENALSEDELDAVAGGKGGDSCSGGQICSQGVFL